MTRVVVFYETGEPEVLRLEDVEWANRRVGEVRIRHLAVGLGLNFADTYPLRDAAERLTSRDRLRLQPVETHGSLCDRLVYSERRRRPGRDRLAALLHGQYPGSIGNAVVPNKVDGL